MWIGIVVCAAMTLTTLIAIGNTEIGDQYTNHDSSAMDSEERQSFAWVHKNIEVNREEYQYETISPLGINSLKTELQIRRTRLKYLCPILEDGTKSLETVVQKIIVDTIHGISWCPIYKARSSRWMENFAVLGGTLSDVKLDLIRQNILQLDSVARQAFLYFDMNQKLKSMNRTKKFLVVRHPFERLLSAYRDKLENMKGREYYYTRYGRHITRQYRRRDNSTNTRNEPTFVEFLRFIVNEKYYDEHWIPYTIACRPCLIDYDYIIKFETFERDEHFLIQELKLQKYLNTRGNIMNINPRGPTTRDTAREYFKHVPRLLLKMVYKIYEKDFKLFNYVASDYYDMSKLTSV